MSKTRLILLAVLLTLSSLPSLDAQAPAKPAFEQYLKESVVTRDLIDRFLRGPSWAQFDPEVGYVLGNYLPSDGLDNSATLSTVQSNGARTSFAYAGKKCRINTYGDSFTHCHQVSDSETWQEYLPRFHPAMCEQKMVEGGVLPEAAYYAAGWHFGNATRAKE